MRNLLKIPRALPISALVLTVGTIIFLALPEPPPREAVKWNPYRPVESLKVDKPIFLEVSSAYCPPCTEMKYTTFQDEKLGKLINEKFYPMRIEKEGDFMDAEKFIRKLGFEGFPTIYILKRDGTLVDSFVGYQRIYTLRWKLRNFLKSMDHYISFHRYPSDSEEVGKDHPWLLIVSSRYDLWGKTLYRQLRTPSIADVIRKQYTIFEVERWPRLPFMNTVKRLSIRARPSLIVLNPETRKVMARIDGLPSRGQLQRFIEENADLTR